MTRPQQIDEARKRRKRLLKSLTHHSWTRLETVKREINSTNSKMTADVRWALDEGLVEEAALRERLRAGDGRWTWVREKLIRLAH